MLQPSIMLHDVCKMVLFIGQAFIHIFRKGNVFNYKQKGKVPRGAAGHL